MFTEERREKILERLNTDGRVIAKDLAERFDMSIDSIRRDLSIMEKDGLLKERTEVQLNLRESEKLSCGTN